jgi:hypothetical protein
MLLCRPGLDREPTDHRPKYTISSSPNQRKQRTAINARQRTTPPGLSHADMPAWPQPALGAKVRRRTRFRKVSIVHPRQGRHMMCHTALSRQANLLLRVHCIWRMWSRPWRSERAKYTKRSGVPPSDNTTFNLPRTPRVFRVKPIAHPFSANHSPSLQKLRNSPLQV